jgi:hypothetical protein
MWYRLDLAVTSLHKNIYRLPFSAQRFTLNALHSTSTSTSTSTALRFTLNAQRFTLNLNLNLNLNRFTLYAQRSTLYTQPQPDSKIMTLNT